MAIFAPPLRRTLQELRDDPEERVWRKDIRSADWDGGTDLSSEDTAATKGYFVDYSTGTAQFEKLFIPADAASIATSETTASTSFTDLATAGPSVTLTTGTRVLVIVTCIVHNSTSGAECMVGYDISGASTLGPSSTRSYRATSNAAADVYAGSYVELREGLTAGSNTFKLKYRVDAGTGTFDERRISVVPF